MSCCSGSETSVAVQAFDRLRPFVDRMVADPRLESAADALDVAGLARAMEGFTTNVVAYNEFHRRERRLWTIKIKNGSLPGDLERGFRESIPAGRERLVEAIGAVDQAAGILLGSGFGEVAQEHLKPFLQAAFDDAEHPFARLNNTYLATAGFSPEMVAEFSEAFRSVDYDLFAAAGGGLENVRELTRQGLQAQLQILDHTEANGFDYLRGACGPPAWAVTASAILASVGIAISAWVIVGIIVVLLATLAIICLAVAPHTVVGGLCRRLRVQLPIFKF